MRGPASRRNRQSDAYDFPEGFVDQPIPESSRNHSIPIQYISLTPSQPDRQSPSIAESTVPELSGKGRVRADRRTTQRSTAFLETRRNRTARSGTKSRLAALRLRHTLKSITCQLPHLTALPDTEEYKYSALFNDEEDFSLDPTDSILRLYPESYKRYIEDQEISFAKRRRLD